MAVIKLPHLTIAVKILLSIIILVALVGGLVIIASLRHEAAKSHVDELTVRNYQGIKALLPVGAQYVADDSCYDSGTGLYRRAGCVVGFSITFSPVLQDKTVQQKLKQQIARQGYSIHKSYSTDHYGNLVQNGENMQENWGWPNDSEGRQGGYKASSKNNALEGIEYGVAYRSNCDHGLESWLLPCWLNKIFF